MTSSKPTLEYLEPTNPKKSGVLVVPAVRELHGKTIAFLNNGWSSFTKIGARMEVVLRQRFGVAELRTYHISASSAVPAELLDRIVEECDAAVVGMAN
jgi:hypothetical protein